MAFDFEKLEVYQKALEVVDAAYDVARSFPAHERYGLGDQLRRAAISIPLNIAEGSGRTKRDFHHFLRNARSSCYEYAAVLQIAQRRSYMTLNAYEDHVTPLSRVSRMLSGLMRSLQP
jgi:four helix bundle protein